jgi:hypothetical protein
MRQIADDLMVVPWIRTLFFSFLLCLLLSGVPVRAHHIACQLFKSLSTFLVDHNTAKHCWSNATTMLKIDYLQCLLYVCANVVAAMETNGEEQG